ncbi:hypothetical protein CAP35_12800 [Chitinophagaceae bacterium IBVUCB1]|nr:hypothetical protein CAP35_12800 [Chitinophagaceae bacterium IBVUCB1]
MRTLKIYTTLIALLLALMYSNNSQAQCTSAAITGQPANMTICSGDPSAFFLVSATGTSLTYQWQTNSGTVTTWTNLSNDATYSGVNTGALVITNPSNSLHAWGYRCVVTAACGSPVITNGPGLYIRMPHSIFSQPTTQQVCAGTTATFSVGATTNSVNTLSYQWQMHQGSGFINVPNAAPYSGVNSPNLSISNTNIGMTGHAFRCEVTSLCGAPLLSDSLALHVLIPPTITSQPVSNSVCQDGSLSFSVAANTNTAFPVNYQWQVNTGSGFNNIGAVPNYIGQQSATLQIYAAPLSFSGNQYRCIVSTGCPSDATSNVATVTVLPKPTVVSNPVNSTLCAGGNTSFTVAGAGSGISYQWQVAGPGSSVYTNIGVGTPYTGQFNPTLNIAAVSAAMNGSTYRCVISGSCAPAAITGAALLTVNTAPVITAQPTNQTVCENNITTSFGVGATGSGLTYQWQIATGGGAYANLTNTAPYSDVTTSSLRISNGSLALQSAVYRCVVSGICAPAQISNAASLTINMLPVVTTNPFNTTTCENGNASFSIAATGTALAYQWQVSTGGGAFTNLSNAGVYSGVNSATLNITGAPLSLHGNRYMCVVSGACSPVTQSSSAMLSINALTVLNTHPTPVTVCAGTGSTFSVGATGGGVNYQWQVNTGSGFTNVSNTAPYTGATTATLSIGGSPASLNGATYRCVVNSTCGPVINSNPALLTVNTAPAIVSAPVNVTVCETTGTAFGVTATGTSLSYQWQLSTGGAFANIANGGIYSGATSNILNISATSASMTGFAYRVVISGTCTPPVMASAQLVVQSSPVINIQPVNTTVCAGTNTNFSINASGSNLNYQWQVDMGAGFANVVNGGNYSGATTTVLNIATTPATFNGYQYRCVITGSCTPVVTSFVRTLTVNTLPAITSSPSGATACENAAATFTVGATGTGLIYQWQVNTGSGFTNIVSGAPYNGISNATLTITNPTLVMSGYSYRCAVSGSCSPAQLSGAAILFVNSIPRVLSNPVASEICAGGSTTFSANASGTSVSYQWQVNTGTGYTNISNGGVYSGATSNVLALNGAPATMHGYGYRCVISGACTPSVTTNNAQLTVKVPPVLTSQPKDAVVCDGTNTTFSVAPTSFASYQWQILNGAVWVNLTETGSYTNTTQSTLNVNNIHFGLDGAQYRCIVSNGCSPNAVSATATLTVYTPPTVTQAPANITVCEGTTANFSIAVRALNPSYQWQENNGSGWVNLTNNNNYFLTNTPTLSVANTTVAMSGYGYRCVVTSDCGTTISTAAVISFNRKPVITKQPWVVGVAYSKSGVFEVSATGTGLTYQWQVDTTIGGTKVFINVNDKPGAYIGATTNRLEVISAAGYMNLRRFRCVVSGTCAPAVASEFAQLINFFATNVSNVANETTLTVYPNPVSGAVLNMQIANYNGSELNVKVTNSMGSLVANQTVTLQNNTATINVANLAAGTYNLHIADSDNNTFKVVRFVKQ